MAENEKNQEAQAREKIKTGDIPLWVSFIAISIIAFIAGAIILSV